MYFYKTIKNSINPQNGSQNPEGHSVARNVAKRLNFMPQNGSGTPENHSVEKFENNNNPEAGVSEFRARMEAD